MNYEAFKAAVTELVKGRKVAFLAAECTTHGKHVAIINGGIEILNDNFDDVLYAYVDGECVPDISTLHLGEADLLTVEQQQLEMVRQMLKYYKSGRADIVKHQPPSERMEGYKAGQLAERDLLILTLEDILNAN
jgi:hypothetical protein